MRQLLLIVESRFCKAFPSGYLRDEPERKLGALGRAGKPELGRALSLIGLRSASHFFEEELKTGSIALTGNRKLVDNFNGRSLERDDDT